LRGQDLVDHPGDILGSEFVVSQQAVDQGFVLAEPEVVRARRVLGAAGAIAIDAEVRRLGFGRIGPRASSGPLLKDARFTQQAA